MYVELNGCTARESIRGCGGLLQGCLASVMCLLADMTVWCYHTENRVPGIQLGAFADDRTIWCKGKHAREKLEKAVTVTENYDFDAGWRWNEGKGSRFSLGPGTKHDIPTEKELRVGQRLDYLALLGVKKKMRRGAQIEERPEAIKKATHQLKRIACAFPCQGKWKQRERIVKILITPKLAWGGRWQRPPKAKVSKWDGRIARVILKPARSASRAAMWTIVDPLCSVDFNLDLDALRHELWEARREVNEIRRRGPDKLRLKETLTKWQWSRREDVEQDDALCIKFETPEGTIDLGADSKAVIWSVAKRSWLQHLWRREKRAGDANSRAKLEEHAPLFGIFRNSWAAGHQSLRRAITGATLEHPRH